MEATPDELRVRMWPALGRCEIGVSGELDVASGARLLNEARRAVRRGCDLALDLTDVTFIDPGGVHALQQICAHAEAAGRHAWIYSPSPAVRRLAELLAEKRPSRGHAT